MTKNRTTNLHDAGVDVKIVLSGLWVSMLFVFACRHLASGEPM